MKPLPILKDLDYTVLILAALLLGLAPFSPEPHLLEKLRMLAHGQLVKGIDIFDLVFHAFPLILLIVKAVTETVWRRI